MRKLFLSIALVLVLFAGRAWAQSTFQILYGIGMMTIEWSVTQTSDNGFVITGFQNAIPPLRIELVKTDSAGNILWANKYGKELIMGMEDPTALSIPMCVRQTADAGFIICGSLNGDAYLLKLNAAGGVEWARTYGDSGGSGTMVKQTADGGFIFTGYRADATKADSTNIYLVKTAANGTLSWDRTYRFSTVDDDGGNSVEVLADGYVVAGYTTQVNGTDTTSDIVLLKTDLSGTLQWAKTWGTNSNFEDAYDVKAISGGLVLTGSQDASVSGLDGSDVYIMTTDNAGNQTSCSGYTIAETDIAWRIEPLSPGYALMGTTFSLFGMGFLDMFLMKVNGAGTPTMGQIYNQSLAHNLFTDGQMTSDGGFVLGGWGNTMASMDMMMIKTAPNGTSGCLENPVTPAIRTYAPATETATPTVIGTSSSSSVTALMTAQTVTPNILCQMTPLVANAGNDQNICQYTPVTLGGTPTGNGGTPPYTYNWSPGTYLSSTTDANPVMTPTTTGNFTYTVTVTDNGGGTATDDVVVIVDPAADANISMPTSICLGAPAFAINGTPAGGTYAGPGVSGSDFDPAAAGLGTHDITYIVCLGSCCDTATASILVYDNPNATIDPVAPLCTTGDPVTLTAADPGGFWVGPGITDSVAGTFDPAAAGAGAHLLAYYFPNPCYAEDTIIITVLTGADATILTTGPLCVFDNSVMLSAADAGGTWTGTGVVNGSTGEYDPSAAGLGTHQVIYSISGTCPDADTLNLLVVSSMDASIDSVGDVCVDTVFFNLTAATAGGTWSGTGISDPVLGTFDAFVAGVGAHQIIYTIPGSCGNADTISINVLSCEVIPVVYIPNIFSPNGDGINDILYVRGQGITELKFFIYDRWGEKIFETTDIALGWDGKFKDKEMDPAVYVYYVKAVYNTGEEYENKGNITLVR